MGDDSEYTEDLRSLLVTGASGFIGSSLLRRLAGNRRYDVRVTSRGDGHSFRPGVKTYLTGNLSGSTNWAPAMVDVQAVVHLAARVHVMHDSAADPLTAFRAVNVAATTNLARQAAEAGVRRLVFVSSVKVNGDEGTFQETDTPAPVGPYGLSKLEAEISLREVAAELGLEVVVIRPPLVYGPRVGANFRALMSAVQRGIPLPLGLVRNRRSLVAVDNLVDLIVTCLDHPAAAGETFFVSNGEDLSTPELIRRLGRAVRRPARLVPVPVMMLRAGALLAGKDAVASRLLGSLQVEIGKADRLLGWTPPLTVDEGLQRAARPNET